MSKVAKRSRNGSLNISDDVLIAMTKQALKEVTSIYSLADISKMYSKVLFGSKKKKPVVVQFNGDIVTIDIGVNLKYGCKVMKAADEIQTKVKEAIQMMTHITVSKVNVYVLGVTFVEENKI